MKRRFIHRLLSLALAGVLIIGSVSTPVFAEEADNNILVEEVKDDGDTVVEMC